MKTTITKYLESIVEKDSLHRNRLQEHVVDWVLSHEPEDQLNYLRDVCQYGCISGVVGHLIWYSQTHSFYDTYYEEIERIRQEREIEIPLGVDLKNYLVWAAFEIIAFDLLNGFKEI